MAYPEMTQEQKKLRLLVENGLQDEQVARWFRDTIPDFSEDKEILGRGSFSIDTLYDKAVENEIQLMIRDLSGSAAPIIKAVKADRWSDRVVEAMMDHHIFPIMLAQTCGALRVQLARRDFHDLRYLGLMPKEIEGALAFLEEEKQLVGIHLLLLVTSNWNLLYLGHLEHPKQNRLLQLLLAASYYGKDTIIDELLLFTKISISEAQEVILAAARAGRVQTAKKLIEELLSYSDSLMQVADQISSEQSDSSDELTLFIWSLVVHRYGQCVISDWAIHKSSKEMLIRAFSLKLLSINFIDSYVGWVPGKNLYDILDGERDLPGLVIFAIFSTKDCGHCGYCSDPGYASEDDSSAEEHTVAFWTDKVDTDISGLPEVQNYIHENSYYDTCWGGQQIQGVPDSFGGDYIQVCSGEICELVGGFAMSSKELRSMMG